MTSQRSTDRRRDILETLAHMLVEKQGEHVTTAALAKAVGVSEAALYRHFPGKAQMFEALIDFIEESVFTRINRILADEAQAEARIKQIMLLLLGFADKNPGITRILHGDVLVGETGQLRARVAKTYDRLETQFKQVLREGGAAGGATPPVHETARLFLAVFEGRIAQFVRSGFTVSPVTGWPQQWELLRRGIF